MNELEILGGLLKDNGLILLIIGLFSNAKTRDWLLKKLFNGNGNENGHKEIAEVKEQIKEMSENHLNTLTFELRELNHLMQEHGRIEMETQYILKSIKEKIDSLKS